MQDVISSLYHSIFSTPILDGFVKSHQNRHPGESRGPELLVFLDSGFRRNDGKWRFGTFYETIILDPFAECHERRHPGESRGPEVLIFLDSGFHRSDSSLRAHHP